MDMKPCPDRPKGTAKGGRSKIRQFAALCIALLITWSSALESIEVDSHLSRLAERATLTFRLGVT